MPTYQLGEWTVESDLNRITSGALEQHLEPRSMDILVYLLEHANDPVSTDTLLDVVWADRVVEPNAVQLIPMSPVTFWSPRLPHPNGASTGSTRPAWQQELCQRIATLPPEAGLTCNADDI